MVDFTSLEDVFLEILIYWVGEEESSVHALQNSVKRAYRSGGDFQSYPELLSADNQKISISAIKKKIIINCIYNNFIVLKTCKEKAKDEKAGATLFKL